MSQDVLSIKPLVPEPPEAPKLPPISIAEQYALEQKRRSGANWFLGIAGLSLVNSVLALAGSTIGFVIGLGITQFIDVVALLILQDYQPESPIVIQLIAFFLDIAIIGFFTIFGLLARRGQTWAFVVGMILYLLDTFFTLFLEMWIGVAFHAFALFSLWNGFQALRTYKQYEKEGRLQSAQFGTTPQNTDSPPKSATTVNTPSSTYVPRPTFNLLRGLLDYGIGMVTLFLFILLLVGVGALLYWLSNSVF